MGIDIPLKLSAPLLKDIVKLKDSIDSFIDLLISTKRGSCMSDDEFGFNLESKRFENINPDTGYFSGNIISGLSPSEASPEKKINGNGRTSNSFAKDLRSLIINYEKRLDNVDVRIDTKENGKILNVKIYGTICDDKKTSYSHEYNINVW